MQLTKCSYILDNKVVKWRRNQTDFGGKHQGLHKTEQCNMYGIKNVTFKNEPKYRAQLPFLSDKTHFFDCTL